MKINRKTTTLWALFLLFGLAACSDDEEGNGSIMLTNGTQTSQTIYADETTDNSGGIHFTAAADWTASVIPVTSRAEGGSSVDWLSLSAYSGGPGEYTLTLTLKKNTTGQDRKAKIEIVCADDVITITVEQKGTTEEGESLVEPTEPDGEKYFVKRIDEIRHNSSGGTDTNIIYFEYDESGRIALVKADEGGEGDEKDMYYTAYEFGGNTITVRQYYLGDNAARAMLKMPESNVCRHFLKTRATYGQEDVTVFTLDEEGKATVIDYEWYDGRGVVAGSANVQYDENGYLIGGTESYTVSYNPGQVYEFVSKAEWLNGNLVKVMQDGGAENSEDNMAEMRYENSAYINNSKVNLDFTWIICESEWMNCFITDMASTANIFGYMGKHSELMMTHESDRIYYGSNAQYTYEYDDLQRPVKIYKECVPHDDSFGSGSTYTYLITYAE